MTSAQSHARSWPDATRGHLGHRRPPAGLIRTPFGDAIMSDAAHDQIVINGRAGRQVIGGPGIGPGEFRGPRGLAFLAGRTKADSRLFVCDALNHRVQVFDGRGEFVRAFGEQGTSPGLFDEPSAIAIVRPSLSSGPLLTDAPARLAVTDRGTGRIQIFTLDGVFFSVLELGDVPAFNRQRVTTLSWSAPHLHAHCANGASFRLHVAAAITGVPLPIDGTGEPRLRRIPALAGEVPVRPSARRPFTLLHGGLR